MTRVDQLRDTIVADMFRNVAIGPDCAKELVDALIDAVRAETIEREWNLLEVVLKNWNGKDKVLRCEETLGELLFTVDGQIEDDGSYCFYDRARDAILAAARELGIEGVEE